jgi:tetratricopeptide (TPR) repeat protein
MKKYIIIYLIALSLPIHLYGQNTSTSPTEVSSTLFLFDLSGSMNSASAGASISKLQQAKESAKQTMQSLKTGYPGVVNEVAVLGFSGSCSVDPTITISNFDRDLSQVESRVDAMRAGGGTPLAEAIAAAQCKFANHLNQNQQGKGKLIVLSDGQTSCQPIRPAGVYNSGQLGKQISTVNAGSCSVNGFLTLKIKYYTIGFNIIPGSAAERDLQYLAQISGGKYLNVQSQTQLERAFWKFNRVFIPKKFPALSNLPEASNTSFKLGVEEIKRDDFEKALGTYEKFVQQHADDCHGVYNLALMQEATDQYKPAIDNYRTYLSLCPSASDRAFVERQIKFLEAEYQHFLDFQKQVVMSDLEFLKLHFQKIQNGQSIALAEEFKGFLKEKGDFYEKLPGLMGRGDRPFKRSAQEVSSGLENCAGTIKRNPAAWDRDASPAISMTYLNLERLVSLM